MTLNALADVDEAFGAAEKPMHFCNYLRCYECEAHDNLLRWRSRDTLAIDDVGHFYWNPIAFISPQGMAYYFPSLARFALSEPTYQYGWYGNQL